MFRNRDDAGRQLAERLQGRALREPLILAIPRGGVVIGAILAQELGAELDVALSRKLRAPQHEEVAVGAVAEDGRIMVNLSARHFLAGAADYLEQECRHQLAEIERRRMLYRAVRPAAAIADRSVIVTDDGIATGATMIAALQTIKAQEPHEIIVAVPVAATDRLDDVREWCDDVVCLVSPRGFWSIGQLYGEFEQLEDAEVVERLRHPASREPRCRPAPTGEQRI